MWFGIKANFTMFIEMYVQKTMLYKFGVTQKKFLVIGGMTTIPYFLIQQQSNALSWYFFCFILKNYLRTSLKCRF